MQDHLYFIISIFPGAAGAWAAGRFAGRCGFLDNPGARSSHRIPTPKGGGIGILAAFIICSIGLGISAALWLPISALSLLALFGDRFELSPAFRMCAQLLVVALLLVAMRCWPANPLLALPWMIFCTVFIVGTANFYNFMDGINGIAAVSGIIAFGAIAFLRLPDQSDPYFKLSLCLVFASAGFLPFNFPRGKVFMGDVGSILLGLCFGTFVVFTADTLLDFLCAAGFLFPFYADELSTMIFRIKDRENLFKPHRRHIYQILVNQMKFPHWLITTGYGLAQIGIIACVFMIRPYGFAAVLVFLGVAFCIVIGLNIMIRYHGNRGFVHSGCP